MTAKKAAPVKKAAAKKAAAPRNATLKKVLKKVDLPLDKLMKADAEAVRKAFPKLMSVDEEKETAAPAPAPSLIPAPVVHEINPFEHLSPAEKNKAMRTALEGSTRVIENFIKLLNMYDRRHESFKQVDMNNALLK